MTDQAKWLSRAKLDVTVSDSLTLTVNQVAFS